MPICKGFTTALQLPMLVTSFKKKLSLLKTGTPLLFVAGGLAARVEHYGVYGKDGNLAL